MDQFSLFEALASSHIQRLTFQFVHCRSFWVRRRPCFETNTVEKWKKKISVKNRSQVAYSVLSVFITWCVLLLCGKSEATNNHQENIGGRTSETAADYPFFANRLSSPCGFYRITKRSLRSQNISQSVENFKLDKRTVDLVLQLVNVVRDSILGKDPKSESKIPSKKLMKRVSKGEDSDLERSRRETYNQIPAHRLEISNMVGGIEFLNEAHISMVSCYFLFC